MSFTFIFWLAYMLMCGPRPSIFYFMPKPVKGSRPAYWFATIKHVVRIGAGAHIGWLLFDALVPSVDYSDLFWTILCFAMYYFIVTRDHDDYDDNLFASIGRGIKNAVSAMTSVLVPVRA